MGNVCFYRQTITIITAGPSVGGRIDSTLHTAAKLDAAGYGGVGNGVDRVVTGSALRSKITAGGLQTLTYFNGGVSDNNAVLELEGFYEITP